MVSAAEIADVPAGPGMKLAVMQPYLFPYIGYFQLMRAVDRFVFFDDVAFIKRGWINGNRIFQSGEPRRFSIPLSSISSKNPIAETRIHDGMFPYWRRKFLTALRQEYARASMVREVVSLVEEILHHETKFISELARHSVEAVMNHVGLGEVPSVSSSIYDNGQLKGEGRILDICEREKAGTYINLPGGKDLYHAEAFAARGITLRFLQPSLDPYPQGNGEFVPALSIIDMLMHNPREKVGAMMEDFELEGGDRE
jgi:hypothetical protein